MFKLLVILSLVSCRGPSFLDQESSSSENPSGNIPFVESKISSNSTETQTIQLGAEIIALKGASVAIQPGSLAVDTSIVAEEGVNIVTASNIAQLGLMLQQR